MNRIVCYTCITGGYDRLQDPVQVTPGVDYVCFSDVGQASRIWKCMPIPVELNKLDQVRRQRMLKICPHRYLDQRYDISVWVDGNITVIGDLNKLLAEYDIDKVPLYVRIHPTWNCIYTEAEKVISLRKEDPTVVDRILRRYRDEKYPEHAGLAETGVMLRRHNDRHCVRVCDAWADEVLNYSKRDQLSFNYVCWKLKFLPGYMVNQFKLTDNDYFRLNNHG